MLNSNMFPGAMRFIPPHPASLSRNMNLQAGVLRLLTSGLLGAGNLEYLSVSGSSRQSQINDAIFERIIVPSEAYIRHFCSRRYHLSRDEFAEINLDLFLKILKMSFVDVPQVRLREAFVRQPSFNVANVEAIWSTHLEDGQYSHQSTKLGRIG
ncbi:hypothetical protein BLNAU_9534 [Blattamonas nauphoetae]|uniref:Uncharacterized protein n=1 Tax=Blattamonas nauphoetae TaxID=2049346 RepID=A0ABQ9XVH3_9EUKA|nr:hypothetical protein BLNAU_9534 [Blattamonas nauphoetae]